MENIKFLEEIINFMQDMKIDRIDRNENWMGIYLNHLRINCIRREKMSIESITILDDDDNYVDNIRLDRIESIIDFLK